MKANTYTNTIQPEDIDLSGLSTIPALYRKVIASVGLNIRKEGYGVDVMAGRGLTWALARCGFEFARRPELYSDIQISVYRGKEDAISYGRNIEIRDSEGEIIGCGITDWCVLDRDSHRPVLSRLTSDLEPKAVGCERPRRIRLFGADKEVSGQAGYSECDFNGHLNNCRYVDWFFNLLPERITSIAGPVRLDINFKSEIMCGSQILASIKEFGDRQIDFCLRQSDSVACLASLSIM